MNALKLHLDSVHPNTREAGKAPQEEAAVRDDRYKLGALITK
jgi:hypothetical protein